MKRYAFRAVRGLRRLWRVTGNRRRRTTRGKKRWRCGVWRSCSLRERNFRVRQKEELANVEAERLVDRR